MGYCYANGEGVEKDIKQAKYWINRSRENGYQPE
jgi:TPR repeat protein